MYRIMIVSGGNRDIGQYQEILAQQPVQFVIGVDEGALWLIENDFKIDLAVGDFDTIGPKGLRNLSQSQIPIKSYSSEKDETDTEIAVNIALTMNPQEILLYGGVGKRLDHTLANVQLLWKCHSKGVSAKAIDPWNRIQLVSNSVTIHREYAFVSLIPFTQEVKGVSLTGFKYPLSDATIRVGETIGISNEIQNESGTVMVKEGILLIMESND